MSFESFGKGEGVTITYGIADVLNAFFAFFQLLHGHLHAINHEILLQSIAGGFFEKSGKITTI